MIRRCEACGIGRVVAKEFVGLQLFAECQECGARYQGVKGPGVFLKFRRVTVNGVTQKGGRHVDES
jgi:hypothetical protein